MPFSRKSLVILIKSKLLSVDAILPLLLELKARLPELRTLIVVPDGKTLDVIGRNYHLGQALERAGAEIACPKRSRLSLILWQAGLLLKLLAGRNMVIKFGSTLYRHTAFMRILKALSKTVEVKALILPFQKAFLKGVREESRLIAERSGGDPSPARLLDDSFDMLLSTLSREDVREMSEGREDIPGGRLLGAGYLRALPAWRSFVEEAAAACPAINSGPYFLFILSCFSKRIPSFEEPALGDVFVEALGVLKKFNPRIKTVFRPHAITNLDELKRLLEKSGYSNYVIDHGHPMILSSKASFAIGTFFSMTMFDVWRQGVPTVEYACYDRVFLERLGGKSIAGDACDFFIDRDPAKLEAAVESMLSGAFKPVRKQSDVERDYPEDFGGLLDFADSFYRGGQDGK